MTDLAAPPDQATTLLTLIHPPGSPPSGGRFRPQRPGIPVLAGGPREELVALRRQMAALAALIAGQRELLEEIAFRLESHMRVVEGESHAVPMFTSRWGPAVYRTRLGRGLEALIPPRIREEL